MKAPLSWLREFVDVPGSPEEIGRRMSLRGLALEGIEGEGDDAVLDFDVTANRPDCLSIRGIAREVATAYQLPLSARPKGLAFKPDKDPKATPSGVADREPLGVAEIPVSIADPDLCSRYVAAVANVSIGASPSWMQSRLKACGVRPINNVVDITNYVLLELGYPMHAFDLAKLAGPAIVVRRARPGERITTLDGKERALVPEILVIADAERAQAIGGVMGGADSEVSDRTTRIVFEAAWFKPMSVRATSKRLGLRTEASYRFERGADLTATAEAMARALQLLDAIDAGGAAGPMVDAYPNPAVERTITLDGSHVKRLLGMEVPHDEGVRILESLGFGVRTLGAWQAITPEAAAPIVVTGDGLQVHVPGWRADVQRAVDVVEEIGRHYGFERLPTTFPAVEQPAPPSDPRIARDDRVRRALIGAGITEAITFAFIDDNAAAPFAGDGEVRLTNPLSEKFTTLRPSLLPGLIDAVGHNRRHGVRDVRLFEIGTRFSPRGETRGVAVAWTGAAVAEGWSGGQREVDFFDVKGLVEHIAKVLNVSVDFAPAALSSLVDGRAAEVRAKGAMVGHIGQLTPALAERRDLPAADAVYVVEVNLDTLSTSASNATRFVKALPRHPSVVRDVALLLDNALSAATVRDTIRAAGPATLVDVREFDRYQGKGIPEGKVSLALHLTFQAADRTLTDAEVNAAMEHILAELTTKLGAVQR
jgi:phenylalanyl-tRNA synthetase beta chain